MKKQHERFFVEEVAKLLGETWALGPDRESPDFIVTEGKKKFGLEVSEVFTGPQNQAGAKMKEKESKTQKDINTLRAEYEKITKIPFVASCSVINFSFQCRFHHASRYTN